MRRRTLVLTSFVWDAETAPVCLMAVVFSCGALIGLLIRFRIGGIGGAGFEYNISGARSFWRVWPLLWSHGRWLLFAFLLGLTALGVFALPVLVLFRGIVFGFAFSALYGGVSFPLLLADFLLTALFTCLPLVLFSAMGFCRGLRECRGASRSESDRPVVLILFLLFAVFMAFVCSLSEIWLLPYLGS